ncbi:hypothetical protein CCY99_02200 [Helicobacter sp. 16-1353]|uniref:RNA-binding S4 domain-containing protein n=1 Tax=Helicobacter sp. 16-1353 TaxID=2004996 RepID=UPI000DCE37F5|nr:RNA-binding S4 domain-containing protein [Helicobacter sp. 16-1353]RAX55001.1 hypothetical protein CCY99_02200 [Helicobacter sp. 16-1353]
MRIDKFLNTTNILKRRTIAQDMIENKLIFINGAVVKSSREVKVGDIIEVRFLETIKKYQVLKIPESKNIPKNQKELYIKEC